MTKPEAIKLMLDGNSLFRGDMTCRYDFESDTFLYRYTDTNNFQLDLNSIDLEDFEVYVELHDLNDAMDHMDQGGIVELGISCGYIKGYTFSMTERGRYISTESRNPMLVRQGLRGKVWKLLDIPTT